MLLSSVPWGSVICSVLGGLSSASFFVLWVFLELNMLCFVALLSFSQGASDTLSGLKYFMVQSTGSVLFLLSSLSLAWFGGSVMAALLLVAGGLKLGAAPAQGWLVSLSWGISWEMFFILMTIQKILPLFFILRVGGEGIKVITFLALLVGPVGALTQGALKSLLVYSSVFGVGWILASGEVGAGLSYLLIYSVGLFLITWFLGSAFLGSEAAALGGVSGAELASLLLLLLSLAGMPPLLGFYAKVPIVGELMASGEVLLLAGLLLGAGMFLFVYVRVCTSALAYGGEMMGLSGLKASVRAPVMFILLAAFVPLTV